MPIPPGVVGLAICPKVLSVELSGLQGLGMTVNQDQVDASAVAVRRSRPMSFRIVAAALVVGIARTRLRAALAAAMRA
jgi:hypothetical protein